MRTELLSFLLYMQTLKVGLKKSSRSQNLTGLRVFFTTLISMIDKRRSYMWPDAIENILMISSFSEAPNGQLVLS
jgi:hypothetical protein